MLYIDYKKLNGICNKNVERTLFCSLLDNEDFTHTHTHTHTHTYIHTYIHTYTHIRVHARAHMHIHVHI